jgi:uncharacterized membrane protein
MRRANSGKDLHRLFELAIFVKGVDGVLETVGGLLLLFVPLHRLDSLVRWLLAHELSSEPHDWIAKATAHLVDSLSLDTKLFGSVYLIGTWSRFFLVYALWPGSGPFNCVVVHRTLRRYQLCRSPPHSIALLVFAMVDVPRLVHLARVPCPRSRRATCEVMHRGDLG